MPLIFNGEGNRDNRGRVIALPLDNKAGGSLLQIDEWGGYEEMKAIFTRIAIGKTTNHQFLHMIGDAVHLSVFGDRIGTLQLSGIAFHDSCDPGVVRQIGMSRVLEYFEENKLSVRQSPIKITIDPSTVFRGYLHTINGDAVSTQSTMQRLYQFQMTLAIPPDPPKRQRVQKVDAADV